MEYRFSDLKKKTVINVSNGKKIGNVSDITVSYPECCLTALSVIPPCALFADKISISPCDIDKIGEDAILVRFGAAREKKCAEELDE